MSINKLLKYSFIRGKKSLNVRNGFLLALTFLIILQDVINLILNYNTIDFSLFLLPLFIMLYK